MGWESGLTGFAELLYALIERRGWSIREFASRAKTQHTVLSLIKAGTRPPPLKHMERWATVLGLDGKDREYFLDLAALACCPDRVLRMFEPGHPAHDVIRMAIENDLLRRRYAAETGEAYEPKKATRKVRRSPQ
jgi:transcriptional regulator with XRE-family HTH domain